MAIAQLINREILVHDDELLEPKGTIAIIRQTHAESSQILFELIEPVAIADIKYSFAVASPRHNNDNIETLLNGGVLGCSITFIPDEKFNRLNPFDISWWRGGAATLGDLVLL
jgi:hypothetical protein